MNADEEDEKKGTLKHFVVTQLDKFFINHIPIDSFKELPSVYMYYFGTVAYVATIALFIYFTRTSYQSSVSQPYISITDSGGPCDTVPIAVTNSYLADEKGNWIGSPEFVYSLAPYDISFNNFEVSSDDQYQAMMRSFQAKLESLGQQATTQNLAQNLMIWMSFVQYYSVAYPTATNFTSIGHGQLQFLEMTGNPVQVFDMAYHQGHLISQSGYCPLATYATFDQANALLSMNMNYTQFTGNSICSAAINPLSFGYFPSVDQNIFTLELDVLAFSTAMAVNLDILHIADLGVASTDFYSFTFQNVSYLTGQYFDLRYPNMNTIVCIQNTTHFPAGVKGVTKMCMYLVGQTLTLPVFNHFGTDKSSPVYCDCATNGRSADCQAFNLLAGLVFYPAPPDTTSATTKVVLQNTGVFNLVRLVTKYANYEDLNRAAYNASFAAAAPIYGEESPTLNTAAWRKSAFKFCSLTGTSVCSMLVFNSLDGISKKVSDYKYQLANGSCFNSISVDDSYWSKLVTYPPTQLTQTYFECYQSPSSALFSAVGIASGNTSLAVPILVMLLLPLLYFLLVAIKQVPPKEEYSDPEKEQAMEMLSILLLRLRDGKTRGVKKNGVLMKLTRELISAAKEEGGFPDSDDEDDDADDEGTSASSPDKKRRQSSKPKNARKKSVYVDSDDEQDEEPSAVDSSDGAREDAENRNSVARPSQAAKRGSKRDVRVASTKDRTKMSVFTRQLEPEKPTVFRRKSATGKRKSSADDAVDRPCTVGDGYYLKKVFGVSSGARDSRKHSNSVSGQEMVTYMDETGNPLSLSHYRDANDRNLPPDMRILNSDGAQSISKFSKALVGEDVDILVDDLMKLFGEVLALRSAQRNGHDSFLQAKQLSAKLIKAIFSELLERDDKTVFIKLTNALCLHASIELNCPLKDIATQYGDRIAYNVGGKVLTTAGMANILGAAC